MKCFCKNLEKRTIEIINYGKKEMIPLTDEENKSYEKQKFVIYAKKNLILIKMIEIYFILFLFLLLLLILYFSLTNLHSLNSSNKYR